MQRRNRRRRLLILLEAIDQARGKLRGIRKQRALDPSVSRLEKDMARAFRAQGKAFLAKFERLKSTFPAVEEVKESAGEGWEKLFNSSALATMVLFSAPIENVAKKVLLVGALQQIADIGMPVKFDLKNPRAVKFLQNYGAAKVTKINETTRDIIRSIVSQAAEEGWSYDKTAKEISSRFKEFAVGKPQQHIDSRAHLVAVTEAANAYEEGNRIVAQDLQNAGLEMEKSWLTVGDSRVSEGCAANAAAGWIGLEEEFPSDGTYDRQRPPRFPGCRCDILYRRKGS